MSDTYDRLQKDVRSVKSDIAALTDQITDAINSFANDAKKQARERYKDARSNAESVFDEASSRGSAMYDRGSAMYDAAYDAASSLEESLEDAITQRPLATVGIALGIGFLIGAAWRR